MLVDDEPLVLIGLQGMLDWNKLGWEIVGTARNGKEALELVRERCPDLVLCDIKMPVMGGLALAKKCQELDLGLPVFFMLTSYEEFDYVKQSINLGVLEYLVKLDLTPQSLENALRRAEHRIQRERALRASGSAVLAPASGLSQYRERFFLQLYGGLFDDGEEFRRLCGDFGLRFDAPYYVVALGALQNRTLDTKWSRAILEPRCGGRWASPWRISWRCAKATGGLFPLCPCSVRRIPSSSAVPRCWTITLSRWCRCRNTSGKI